MKAAALLNMPSMSVTLETSQPEMSALNFGAFQNMPAMSVTPETFQPERSPLKEVAPLRPSMPVTLETFQPERSPLKAVAPSSILAMLVTPRDVPA